MGSVNPVAPSNFFSFLSGRAAAVSRKDSPALHRSDPVASAPVADVVDLSPQAQSFLIHNDSAIGANDNGNLFGTGFSDGFGFFLTEAQEKTIAEILASHKGQPFNQTTFNSILDDLTTAGLSPQQLAVADILQFFDPTAVLASVAGTAEVDFLGNSLDLPLASGIPGEQANMNAYMLQIITRFLNISLVE